MVDHPWIVGEAIKFLEEHFEQHPNGKVLEFGAGGSTVWLSNHGLDIISIEHTEQWYNEVKSFMINENRKIDIRLVPRPYNIICNEFPNEYFDYVFVDGRDRVSCCQSAVSKLKSNGILMLDDAERYAYAPVFEMCNDWITMNFIKTGPDHSDGPINIRKTTLWIKP